MENILKQIPQSVSEMYKITANDYCLTMYDSDNFTGFTNPEIEVQENETVVKLVGKTFIFTMWKNVKATHMTIL